MFSQHCKAARDAGFTDEQVDAIPHWQVADCYDDKERAVLAYADCLVQGGRTPDAVFDKLKTFLSDEEITLDLDDAEDLTEEEARRRGLV